MVTKIDKTQNVDKIFEVIELMEELRDTLRKTAPLHLLNTKQKQETKELISKAKSILNELEESLCD
ncbi:MAG: hypothetical protein AB1567_08395 [bacterium]